mgnify:CR=1 FL=1
MNQRSKYETALKLAPGVAVIAHVTTALTHGGPVAVPDVPAYLSVAQRFWGAVPVIELPYHPGYGFLVAPLGFLSGDALHTAALCVNAVLAGIVVWMVQRLVRRSEAPQWVLWCSTAISVLHPSISHTSRVAWPETLLVVLLLSIGLCVTSLHPQKLYTVGLLAGLAPLVHPRAVVLAVSVLFLGWCTGRVRETAIGAGLGLLATVATLQISDTWQAARLTAAQTVGSEPGPIVTGAGQLLAFSTSTAGLGLIGIFSGITLIVRQKSWTPHDQVLSFFALSAGAMLVLGGWVLAGSNRSDTLLYGRYMDPWAVPIVVSTLCLVAKRPISRKIIGLSTVAVVVAFALVRVEVDHVTEPARGVMTASLRVLWVAADENLSMVLLFAALTSLISIVGMWRNLRVTLCALLLLAAASTVVTHSHLRDVGQVSAGQATLAGLVSDDAQCLAHDSSSVKPYAIWLYRVQLPRIQHRNVDLSANQEPCGVFVIADTDALTGCTGTQFLGQEPRATWGLWRYPVAGCG